MFESPVKVLITGGREIGGVDSFAAALGAGFTELGIASEVVAPRELLRRWKELRDPRVLKILSTTGFFAAPFVRRAICIAHGHPQATIQGWPRMLVSLTTFKLANLYSQCQLVTVSDYIAAQLAASYRMRIDGVVRNPLKVVYLERPTETFERNYVTYVGRLVASKNLDRLLPVMRELINEKPGLRVCIVGGGPQVAELKRIADGDERVEFKGNPDDLCVRDLLRRTRVFVSGNTVEGLGITYLEALSQGCAVAMPACGGGLELGIEQIGRQIQLLPISFKFNESLATLRRAVDVECDAMSMDSYSPKSVAAAYLEIDARRISGKSTAATTEAQTTIKKLTVPLQ